MDGVLQCAGVFVGCLHAPRFEPTFGFSPKISTPVENTVEKQVKWSSSALKCPGFGHLRQAKVVGSRFFGPPHARIAFCSAHYAG